MNHSIPVDQLSSEIGPQVHGMARAIEACVHCGFCLAACPTYLELGEEMDSPRGRIILMKSALEKSVPIAETLPYIDRCLGCLACVTACPSGVQYGELVVPYKNYAQRTTDSKPLAWLQRRLVQETLPYPGRFRLAAELGNLARPLSGLLPEELKGMLRMVPDQLAPEQRLPVLTPAQGSRRGRAALLAGCVQQVLDQEINLATLRVLARNGIEVVIPTGQGCCGAILMHSGDEGGARRLARQNLLAFSGEYDAILTNAAGCGSGMKEYKLLFEGQPEAEQAAGLITQVQDASVFLASIGMEPPPALAKPLKVAYHDACHLLHAQGVSGPPRQLLNAIPNLTLLPIPQADFCCGSAGTYNLTQPELSHRIGQRKVEHILSTGCELVVTGNIGCMVQLRKELQEAGSALAVLHTFQLLDLAYRQATPIL